MSVIQAYLTTFTHSLKSSNVSKLDRIKCNAIDDDTRNVIRNALWLLINETDVRNAPETNSAISDVMNDEHVSSVVA